MSIETIIRKILGEERVRSVKTESIVNFDNESIVRISIVYDAGTAITEDEMTKLLDALWTDATQPFPVIDFQEDTDIEPVAAE